MVYSYNGTWLSHKKEQTTDHATFSKSLLSERCQTRECILYNSIYVKFSGMENLPVVIEIQRVVASGLVMRKKHERTVEW